MTMAISMAVDEGAKAVVCASTGNTSASAAAYASRAGPGLRRADPRRPHRAGQVGAGPHARRPRAAGARELRPAPHHRARPAEPRADHRRQLGQPAPDRGADDRRLRDRGRPGRRPRRPLHPGGQRREYFGLLAGLSQVQGGGPRTRLPQMLGFQAAGAAPIVLGHPVENPETIATAIRIGNPASWYSATAAASESGGSITAVTDDEIMDAYTFLAQQESVFCEAASSASVAGLIKHGRARGLHRGVRVDRARAQGPRPRHQGDLGPLGDRPQAGVGPGRDLPVEGESGCARHPLTCGKAGCVGMTHPPPAKVERIPTALDSALRGYKRSRESTTQR